MWKEQYRNQVIEGDKTVIEFIQTEIIEKLIAGMPDYGMNHDEQKFTKQQLRDKWLK